MKPRPLHLDEVPRALGIDPSPPSRWTLWMQMRGDIPEPPAEERRLEERLRPAIVDWLELQPVMRRYARRPRSEATHPRWPIVGSCDLVIDEAPEIGEGHGIVLVEIVSYRRWAEEWHGEGAAPRVSAAAEAKAHMALSLGRARWALVYVFTGLGPPRGPIIVRRDPAKAKALGEECTRFHASVAAGDAPEPDAKGDGATLARLARNPIEGSPPSPQALEDATDAVATLHTHRARIDQAHLDLKPDYEAADAAIARIAARTTEAGGTLELGEIVVRTVSESRARLAPEPVLALEISGRNPQDPRTRIRMKGE